MSEHLQTQPDPKEMEQKHMFGYCTLSKFTCHTEERTTEELILFISPIILMFCLSSSFKLPSLIFGVLCVHVCLDVAFSDVSKGEDFVRTGKSRSQVPSQEVSFDQKKNNPSSRPPVHCSSLSLEENQLANFFLLLMYCVL